MKIEIYLDKGSLSIVVDDELIVKPSKLEPKKTIIELSKEEAKKLEDYSHITEETDESPKRRKKYYRKPPDAYKKSKKYNTWVTRDWWNKVHEALPATVKEIQKKTGFEKDHIRAALDTMDNKEKKYVKGEPVYSLKLPRETVAYDKLENDITKELSTYYDCKWSRAAVRDLSLFLNGSERDSYKTGNITRCFKGILEKHRQQNDAKAYVAYFLKDGMLKKEGWTYYVIKKQLNTKGE